MRKKTMTPMEGATIQDVFVKGTQIAIYTRTARGIEALSVFSVEDQELRERIGRVLVPGLSVSEAAAKIH